ncbi:MAG: hypothetical protein OXC72_06190, partial [Roseovarius sp.]|nr:hypothetical protein [Roseovarius sp.]
MQLETRGRPRPRFGSGLSRASMAVESREMRSTTLSRIGDRIIAACTLAGNSLSANSAKARENVASLGISDRRDHPHGRRRVGSA